MMKKDHHSLLITAAIVFSVIGIVILLSIRGFLPPAPERMEVTVSQMTVQSYRCRTCNPHANLCPQEEAMHESIDANHAHFSPVVTKMRTGTHYFGFETRNLIFRELEMNDLDAFYAYASKPSVAARTTWLPHRSKMESKRLLSSWIEGYQRYQSVPWGIVEKKSNRLIGTAAFPLAYEGQVRIVISFCLDDTAWQKGYEKEITQALIEVAFLHIGFSRVETLARHDDPETQQALEAAGMSYEGMEPDFKKVGTQFVSMKSYAILKRDILEQLRESILYRQ